MDIGRSALLWADEMVEILADLMDLDEEELWDMLDEGEDLQDLLDTHKVEVDDEDLKDEIHEFLEWWNEDDFDEEDDRENF